jgi:hypothetical protein
MDNNIWLEKLKAGDEAYLSERYGVGSIVRVKRITNTQIVIEHNHTGTPFEEKYRRSDGRSISGDVWNRSYVSEPTSELREEIEIDRLKSKAKKLIEKLIIPKTKTELIEFNNTLVGLVKTKPECPST